MSADDPLSPTDADATIKEDGPPRASKEPARRLGSYRVLRELGRGGQGRVYLAEDERLRRRVALKVLEGASGDALLRFRREAEVASKLDHAGICAVYEIGEEEGVAFIAMRYVEGRPLSRVLAAARETADGAGRTPNLWAARAGGGAAEAAASDTRTADDAASPRDDVGRTLAFVEKAARALHAAHEQGVVHRDVKPANLMVSPDGDPVVLDFGLAGVMDDASAGLTRTGEVFGTPAYMAPEQVVPDRGKPDRRTDVFALAAVLYECLTLRRPFDRPTRDGLFTAILAEEPPDPRGANKNVSRDVRTVLETALEKEPRRRYQTALDFAEDLRRARLFESIRAKPAGAFGRAARFAKRRPAAAALAATLLVGAPVVAWLGATHLANRPIVAARLRAERDEAVEDLLNQGFLRTQIGDLDGARAIYARARTLNPDLPEALVGEAYALLKTYRPADAERALAILAPLPDEEVLPLRMAALVVAGRGAEADALGDAAPPASPRADRSPVASFVRGLDLLAPQVMTTSRPTGALLTARDAAYRAVLASPKPRRLYFASLCEIAARVAAGGAYADRRFAEAAAESMTFHWPTDPSAWFARSVAAQAANAWDEAAARLRRALELLPADAHAVVRAFYESNLAVALAETGSFDEADRRLADVVARHPDFPAAHANRVAVLQRRGRTEDALPSLRRLLVLRPEDPSNFRILGSHLLAHGRVAEAATVLARAAELAPNHADGRHNLASALTLLGRRRDALREQEAAARLAPEDAQIAAGLATARADVGDLDGAAAAVAAAEALDAEGAAADFVAAARRRVEREREDVARAARVRDGAEEPEDAADAVRLAVLRAAQGDAVGAARVLDFGPDVADDDDPLRRGRRALLYGAASAADAASRPEGRAAWRLRALAEAERAAAATPPLSWRLRALIDELAAAAAFAEPSDAGLPDAEVARRVALRAALARLAAAP